MAPPLRSGSGGELGIRGRESGRGVEAVKLSKMTAAVEALLFVASAGKTAAEHVVVLTAALLTLLV
jgi:hypothetical protein